MKDEDNESNWNLIQHGDYRDWYYKDEIKKTYFINTDYTAYYSHDQQSYHRLSGPARSWGQNNVNFPGRQEWWIDGEKINCSTQEEFEKIVKLKAFW